MSQRPVSCPGCTYSGQPHLEGCERSTYSLRSIIRTSQAADAVEKWVEAVMYDQAVEYDEAFKVVMAKIQAKISENKRQVLFFADDKFRVKTVYSNSEGSAISQMEGVPHVEVLDGGVKIGCITIENEAILELIASLATRIRRGNFVVQTGYMPK